jgi:hypothetical protein
MASPFSDRAILSRPFPVEWAGFRSDTFTLQRRGWNLAVERYLRDYSRMEQLELIGQHEGVRFSAIANLDRWPSAYLDPALPNQHLPVFGVRYVAHELEMRTMHAERPQTNYWKENFEAIDCRPQWVEVSRLSEAQLFAPANTAAMEVFVREADLSVLDHLEAIKKLQAPIQAEIRENDRRQEWRTQNTAPASRLLANVIQLRA